MVARCFLPLTNLRRRNTRSLYHKGTTLDFLRKSYTDVFLLYVTFPSWQIRTIPVQSVLSYVPILFFAQRRRKWKSLSTSFSFSHFCCIQTQVFQKSTSSPVTNKESCLPILTNDFSVKRNNSSATVPSILFHQHFNCRIFCSLSVSRWLNKSTSSRCGFYH